MIIKDPRMGDIIVNDPRNPYNNPFKRMNPAPRHVNLSIAHMFPGVAGPNGASVLDFGAFRGFENVFGDDMSWLFTGTDVSQDPGYPSASETSGGSTSASNPSATGGNVDTSWLGNLFNAIGSTVGGVATVVGGAIGAGQKPPTNPTTGQPYTQQEWANRPQPTSTGLFGSISPLMIAGVAVLGIGAVVLLTKKNGSKSVAGFAGFGKRKRRRVKSRRR